MNHLQKRKEIIKEWFIQLEIDTIWLKANGDIEIKIKED